MRVVILSVVLTLFFTGAASGQRADVSGKVYGTIQEDEGGMPVEFATVAIFRQQDSTFVKGVNTDGGGNFQVESLPMGEFIARVNFLGYDEVNTTFVLSPSTPEKNLGVIKIMTAATMLEDVVVTAQKDEYISNIDKKVYDVSKNLVSIGGSATDVLANIPSVSVDIDGNVSLRGSDNLTIFIDGKPSSITGNSQTVLQSIPSSLIERVEIITNPSAKYDAAGMAGIINIVTKKEKIKGINGDFQLGAGTRDKYNGAASINRRSEKFNLFANYAIRHSTRFLRGKSENIFTDSLYKTNSDGTDIDDIQSGKAGLDWYLNKNNTLSVTASVTSRKEYQPQSIDYTFYNSLNEIDSTFTRRNLTREKNPTYEAMFDYRKKFQNPKQELALSGNYSITDQIIHETFANSAIHDLLPYQLNDTDGKFVSSVLQADYVHPFSNKNTMEAGLKGTYRLNDTDQKLQGLNSDTETYSLLPSGNQFIYDEKVLAAYVLYNGKAGNNIEYNAGARAEQTIITANSVTDNTSFDRNYLSLFPSGTVKYTPNSKHEIQLTYSRRINRPTTRDLNPFIDYSDSLSLRTGNPYINPEFISSLDLTYSRFWEKISLTNSLFYRYTTDNITNYTTVDEVTKVQFTRPINFSSSENLGVEVVIRYQIDKVSSLMWSFNGFQNKINGNNVESNLQSNALSWNTRLTGSIKVGKHTFMQLTGFYMAPRYSPQGSFQGMNSIDVGARQELFKGNSSLTLNVSDVFNTRKWRNIRDLNDLHSESERKRESRIGTITFSYRFGRLQENNNNQRNRKNQQNNNQQDNGGDDF